MTGLARRCGFGRIRALGTAGDGGETSRISFVLVHYLLGDALLGGILRAIRTSGDLVRFSPVIVITDDCPFEMILAYVEMGLDDVISLPEKKEILIQRFATQIATDHLYIETPGYFGPDRRRMKSQLVDSRRKGMDGHVRFHFVRNPSSGIEILRHQIFAAANHSGLGDESG